MIAESIKERLLRDPFEPFVIRASRGQHLLVARADPAVMMKSEIFVPAPNSDRWAQIPYLHVAGIESAGPARGSPKSKRRR